MIAYAIAALIFLGVALIVVGGAARRAQIQSAFVEVELRPVAGLELAPSPQPSSDRMPPKDADARELVRTASRGNDRHLQSVAATAPEVPSPPSSTDDLVFGRPLRGAQRSQRIGDDRMTAGVRMADAPELDGLGFFEPVHDADRAPSPPKAAAALPDSPDSQLEDTLELPTIDVTSGPSRRERVVAAVTLLLERVRAALGRALPRARPDAAAAAPEEHEPVSAEFAPEIDDLDDIATGLMPLIDRGRAVADDPRQGAQEELDAKGAEPEPSPPTDEFSFITEVLQNPETSTIADLVARYRADRALGAAIGEKLADLQPESELLLPLAMAMLGGSIDDRQVAASLLFSHDLTDEAAVTLGDGPDSNALVALHALQRWPADGALAYLIENGLSHADATQALQDAQALADAHEAA